MSLISLFEKLTSLKGLCLDLEETVDDTDTLWTVVDDEELDSWMEQTKNKIMKEASNFSVEDLCKGYKLEWAEEINLKCISVIEQKVKNEYNIKEIRSILETISPSSLLNTSDDECSVKELNVFNEILKKKSSILFKSDVINKLIQIVASFSKWWKINHYNTQAVVIILQLLAKIALRNKQHRNTLLYGQTTQFVFYTRHDSDTAFLPNLLSLCDSNQSFEILLAVLYLIGCIFMHKGYDETFAKMTLKTLPVIFAYIYRDSDLVAQTLYVYSNILHSSKLKMTDFNVKIDATIIKQMKCTLIRNKLLISGYVRKWDVKENNASLGYSYMLRIDWDNLTDSSSNSDTDECDDCDEIIGGSIVIPLAINGIIERYFSLTNNQQINNMNNDKVKQFVELIVDKNKNVQIEALQVIFRGVKTTLKQMIDCGLLDRLKQVDHDEAANEKALYIVLSALKYGNDEEIKKIVQSELLFSLMFKLMDNKVIVVNVQKHIQDGIKRIVKLYQYDDDIDVLAMISDKISYFLQSNRKVITNNKEFLERLIQIMFKM